MTHPSSESRRIRIPALRRAALALFLSALAALPAPAQRIMEWNVENLFDTRHDSLKSDTEFTPDGTYRWTRGRYWHKLDNIARTIAAVAEYSGWPMMVGLCEVENDTVLRDLTQRSPLRTAEYGYVHFEGPDLRGIDVALLYRPSEFSPVSSAPVRVPSAVHGLRPTRDILHVCGRCVASGRTLHVFVVHFPSRAGDSRAADENRMLAATTLCGALDSLQGADVMVMGDFNASPGDRIFGPILGRLESLLPQDKALRKAGGTYCFRRQWEFLDHILVSPGLAPSVRGRACVADYPFLLTEDGMPWRTFLGPRYGGGFSDHLPLYVDLRLR